MKVTKILSTCYNNWHLNYPLHSSVVTARARVARVFLCAGSITINYHQLFMCIQMQNCNNLSS